MPPPNLAKSYYPQVEAAGKLKASKQLALVNRFMQFIVTPALQSSIPLGNWMHPADRTPQPIGFE
jgi:thiamine transport system substrate-binding protein